jgi:hypothetical protein
MQNRNWLNFNQTVRTVIINITLQENKRRIHSKNASISKHNSKERQLQLQTRITVQHKASINADEVSPISKFQTNVAEDK